MAGELHQLPRGRHRLSRDEVLASQRGRLLAAVAETVAEKGFSRTSVADVIRRAGVSRETFYEQFTDKEDCFVSALDAGANGMLELLAPAVSATAAGPRERLDRVLAAYLGVLSEEPSFAKAYLIDAYGAGTRATTRRIELQQRFVTAVSLVLGAETEADRFAAEALVAAVSSLVTVRVGAGRADELPGLRGPLMALADRLFPELDLSDVEEAPLRAHRRANR